VEEQNPMNSFDNWVHAFVAHVKDKGPVTGMKEAERSALTTTNQDRKKA